MKIAIRRMTDYRRWLVGVIAVAGLAVAAPCAQAQIFVANVNDEGDGIVSEYDLSGALLNSSLITTPDAEAPFLALSGSDLFVPGNTGSLNSVGQYTLGATPGTIASSNPSFLTGLNLPEGIAVSGSNLFVGSYDPANGGTIGEYTTSGATVNASLLTGFETPDDFDIVGGLAVSGSDLFVAITSYGGGGSVGEYVLGSTPGTITSSNSSFISGVDPLAVAVSGSYLFVLDQGTNTVSEYTTSGTLVNPSLISGFSFAEDLVISGPDLFVTDIEAGTVGEYTLGSTPGTIASSNPTFISGLNSPVGIEAFGEQAQVIPEPSTWALLLAGLGALIFWRVHTTRRAAGTD